MTQRLALALTLLILGCGGSSGSRPPRTGFAQDGVAVSSGARIVDGTTLLALQAALALMEPTFPPVGTGATIRSQGTATQGSVDLDFGSGTSSGVDVFATRLRGVVAASYTRSGANATVTITFPSLSASTTDLGGTSVSGTITFQGTVGSGSATGSVTGLASVFSGEIADYAPAWTATLTSSGGTVTATQSGAGTSRNTVRGSWTLSFVGLTWQLAPGRALFPGTITLTRSGSTATVTMVFDGPQRGRVSDSAAGTNERFEL